MSYQLIQPLPIKLFFLPDKNCISTGQDTQVTIPTQNEGLQLIANIKVKHNYIPVIELSRYFK